MTVFDFEGQVIATTTKVYKTYRPQPAYVEQNAGDWWKAVCQGIQEMLHETPRTPLATSETYPTPLGPPYKGGGEI